MRIHLLLASMLSSASLSMASWDYDFSGNADTTMKIVSPSSQYGLVVNADVPVFAQGTSGATVELGGALGGVWVEGDNVSPAIVAGGLSSVGVFARGHKAVEAYGGSLISSNAFGVQTEVLGDYATGVSSLAWGGISPLGVRGEARTPSNNTWIVGVHGLGTNGWLGGGSGNNTIGVRAEAIGNNNSDNAYGIWASATGASGQNLAGYFDGNVTVTGICACSPSDEKLKKNVKPLDKGLATVMALQPKAYDMKVEEYKGKINLAKGHQLGLIAQDVEKVVPELIAPVSIPARETQDKDGKVTKVEAIDYKSVNYVGLIPVLIKAIQEQEVKIQALEKKLAAK